MSDQLTKMYIEGLRALAAQGLSLRHEISNAKTKVKKQYFQKKMKTNSEKAARLLVKLERVTSSAKAKESENESSGSVLTG